MYVNIRHPKIEGTAEVTQEAFDVVWKSRGYEIADEVTPDGTTTVDTANGTAVVAQSPVDVEAQAQAQAAADAAAADAAGDHDQH